MAGPLVVEDVKVEYCHEAKHPTAPDTGQQEEQRTLVLKITFSIGYSFQLGSDLFLIRDLPRSSFALLRAARSSKLIEFEEVSIKVGDEGTYVARVAHVNG